MVDPDPEPAPAAEPIPDETTPSWATEEPAPGPADQTLPGGQVFDLASLSPGGGVPVAVGKSHRPGPGGQGTGTGGGGDPDSEGKGPAPVSIAMIKKRPVPIGDTGFVDASKNYPEAAKREGIEGPIKVKLLVDREGKVSRPRLVTKLGHGLDQLALRLASKLRFEPALDANDKPVAATVVWTFHFTLPR
jgi:protein TonB